MHLISVYACDKCGKIIALKTDEDFNNFENTWSDTVLKQFCPTCKHLPEIAGEIKVEQTQFQLACERLGFNSILSSEEI